MFLIFWNFEIQSPRSIDIAYFAAMHHLNFCTCKIKLSTETPKSTYRTSWFDKKVQSILVDRPAPNTFYVVGPLNFFLEKKKKTRKLNPNYVMRMSSWLWRPEGIIWFMLHLGIVISTWLFIEFSRPSLGYFGFP